MKKTSGKAGLEVVSTPRQHQGFETAGGQVISISEQALLSARKMLDSAAADTNINCIGNASAELVSENAQPNARKMADPSESGAVSVAEDVSVNQWESHVPKSGMCGFQTAGGKNVTVSKKALQHAQNVLRGDDNPASTHLSETSAQKQPHFAFQTASGNNVSISDRALKHAHSLFQNDSEFHSSEGLSHEASETGFLPSVKRPTIRSEPSAVQVLPPQENTDLSVPVVVAENRSKSPVPHQHSRDSCVSSTHHDTGKRQERRSKEDLQPVVSDDSREMVDNTKSLEVCPGIPGKGTGHRVAVKRMAVHADSEAILHDRSSKRFKLQPLSACDKDAGNVIKPFTPPTMSGQSKSSAPKCSFPGRSASAFQPPYKKPKFSPPVGNKTTDVGASQRPGFKPPSVVSSSASASDGASAAPVEQPDSSKEQRVTEGNLSPKDASRKDQVGHRLVSLTKEGKSIIEDESNTVSCVTQISKVGSHPPKSAAQNPGSSESPVVAGSEQSKDGIPTSEQSRDSTPTSEQSRAGKERSMAVEEARMRQEKIIRQKRRRSIKPVQGRWLTGKLGHQTTKLADLCAESKWHSRRELQRLGVSPAVCSVASNNAVEFRFYLPSFYPGATAGVLVGDGALLVPDVCGYAGKEEFYSGFLTVEGVDPALVTDTWLYNHYRWIVWKLAAYEVGLPATFASRALTPDIVMYQLKYRYDREVDGCQRSALKRIVERDDTPCRRLVLCVSGINTVEGSDLSMLEVTDGWYCLPCKPDSALQAMIDRKKLEVGQKIVTSGAELAGSQESCSPLELSGGLHLKVHGNSTRRAGGGAKLGYQCDPAPLCVPLTSLRPQGGLVGCVDVVVVRRYPLMYMERPSHGGCVFRTEEMEDRARRRHQEQQQAVVEKLCSQLQAQMEQEEAHTRRGRHKRSLKKEEVQALTSGADISVAMETVPHPEELQSMLSTSQMDSLLAYRSRQQEEYQQRLNERLQEALKQSSSEGERSVTPLQKFRIVGCCRRDIDSKTDVMLTVWRPGPDWENIQEGRRYRIYGLTASSSRCHSSGRSVELSAGRQARLRALRMEENLLDLVYEPREVSCVSDLRHKGAPHSEVDFVGLVVSIKTAVRGSDAVYAVDTRGDLLLIWFWGGLQTFCVQDTLREGAAFAASNLRLKSWARELVECSASVELSHISASGKTTAQRQLLQTLKHRDWGKQLVKDGRNKLSRITSFKPAAAPAAEILEDLPPSFLDKLPAPLSQVTSATPPHTTDSANTTTTNSVPDVSTTPNSKSVTGTGPKVSLGTTTVMVTAAAEEQALSPAQRELERKRRAQREKLGRLAAYGRAPSLSPLPLPPRGPLSPAVGRAFKPPTPQRK
ncbi:uncharacterized protein LOC143275742 [Babylonia areolata]|uniref:uncharacterized protein LOC143275742 n=1 Tax=Babylonia areolata TaxID=304850 RepID=UPI003FD3757B